MLRITICTVAFLATVLPVFGAAPNAAQPDASVASPKNLQAIFLEVDGKVRWRADEQSAWREAKVNDLVGEGAEVRTGLRSRAALRVGRNATILVDAGTSFEIPQLEQDGQTLRTLASVKTGRVDFKVDKVGFSNDFKVATPQTTLSVRGTGFAVNSGPLNGVEVVGARTNMINAIELKYVTSNLKYFMSGASTSSSRNQDPVKSAWLSTLGPPQVAGTIADRGQLEQAAAQGQAGNAPTNSQQAQQIGAAESQRLPRTQDSPIAGLLRLQEGDYSTLKARTRFISDETRLSSGQGSEGTTAGGLIESAHEAAVERRNGIEATVSAYEDIQEKRGELNALVSDLSDNQQEMGVLRTEMDAAIEADDDESVASKLDRMAEIDDAWQAGLKAEATALVTSLAALRSDLESAAASAQAGDGDFNALLPDAQAKLSVVQATADTLGALQSSIKRYQDAVAVAVRSGEAGEDVIRKLLRSVEILQDSTQRISSALASLDAATARLEDSQGIVNSGDALAVAINALLDGQDLTELLPELQGEINSGVGAIEAARFGAFFAAAAAGAAAIGERSDLSAIASAESIQSSQQVDALWRDADPEVEGVVTLAGAMDQFWNNAGEGRQVSPKARMEALLAQSEEDRTEMSVMLTDLNGFIDVEDQAGATGKLGEMRTLDATWQAAEGGLLSEVHGIDDEMQGRLAAVQAANGKITVLQTSFDGLMAAAEARRDASALAAGRATQLLNRLEVYRDQYEALVAAGRGGSGGAALVANARDAIAGSLAAYEAGIDASQEAALAAEDARSNGQRVLNAAASNALARQAALTLAGNLAAVSQALRNDIDSNAAQMHQDLLTGEQNFENAFGGQSGGGGAGGGG